MANLLMHCGGRNIARSEIGRCPTPGRTESWVPVPHARLLEIIERTISGQGFRVTNQAHGLWGDNGARYFGLLELANGHQANDYNLVLGVRNSHDKTFPASLALGSQVLVCDNLSFYGEVVIARRHTRFIERDLPGIVAQAMGRIAAMRHEQDQQIAAYKSRLLSDRTVHDLVVRAVDAGVIPVTQIPLVLAEWRGPRHVEFTRSGRSAWRLFNAFTESFKTRSLEILPRRSQALHGVLGSVCRVAA